jgi:hypothetical protein
VYKASKEYNSSPPSTLKYSLLISPPAKEVPVGQKRKPFNLTTEDEIKPLVTSLRSLPLVYKIQCSRREAICSTLQRKEGEEKSFNNVPEVVCCRCDEESD